MVTLKLALLHPGNTQLALQNTGNTYTDNYNWWEQQIDTFTC